MRITYDEFADAMFVYLAPSIGVGEAKVGRTCVAMPEVTLVLGDGGKLLGIEILYASTVLSFKDSNGSAKPPSASVRRGSIAPMNSPKTGRMKEEGFSATGATSEPRRRDSTPALDFFRLLQAIRRGQILFVPIALTQLGRFA